MKLTLTPKLSTASHIRRSTRRNPRSALLIIFSLYGILTLSSCNVGVDTPSLTKQTTNPSSGSGLNIGIMNPIPSSNALQAGEYTLLEVSNKQDQVLNLQETKLNLSGKYLSGPASTAYVDSSPCLHLAAHQSCQIKIKNSANVLSYLLEMTFQDNSGTKFPLNQLISFSQNLPSQQGFVYSTSNLSVATDGSLSIPFRLAQDYQNIQVQVTNPQTPATSQAQALSFSCNGPKSALYTKNTLCTAIVHGADLATRTQPLQLEFIGQTPKQNSLRSTSLLSLSNNQNANIITSGLNITVSPDDGSSPQLVTLKNTGTGSATRLAITAGTPASIQNNSCPSITSSLPGGGTCTFQVNVTGSPASGESTAVVLTYFDGQNNQAVYFNLSYINSASSPALTLVPAGTFTNKVINTGNTYYTINVLNSGSASLTNLTFNNLNLQNSSMQSNQTGTSCISGQSLSAGASCVMVLSYSPVATGSGNVNFIPLANYTDPAGNTLTYANSVLTIPYSAINPSSQIFVAAGDFGMVTHSPAGGSGTWIADVNSPFSATANAGVGLNITNGNSVLIQSTGTIAYSTESDLFWQVPTTATNFSASTCNVAFDGSNYYICGTSSSTLNLCANTGRGCVLKSSALPLSPALTWSGVWQPAAAVAIPDLLYAQDNSGNKAYLALQANTTTGVASIVGFGYSIGGAWAGVGSGLTAPNNSLTTAVYNPTSARFTVWDTVGFNTSNAISTVGTTASWTANTANRPGGVANPITGSAINTNSGLYIVTTSTGAANGGIYTNSNANSTGAYSGQLSPVTNIRLNSVAYAQIGGVTKYLVVGNSGTNLTSSTTLLGSWTNNTTQMTVGQSTSPNLNRAYYDGSNFWAIGVNAMFKSSNTSTWITPGVRSLAKFGSTYLAVDNQGNIFSSSNLTTWSLQTNPSGQVLNALYCNGSNLCYAVGNNGTILKSTDGSTWVAQTSNTTVNLNAITCVYGTCLAVGGTGSANSGTVVTSTNYSSWTVQTSSLASTNLTGVSFINSQYLIVGAGGKIFTSNNTQNWTSQTSGTTNDLNAVTCDASLGCITVGNGGIALFSGYGIGWVSTSTAGVTNDLMAVSTDGQFVAVGKGGVLLTLGNSSTTWSQATFPASSTSNTNLYAVMLR